MYMAHGINDHAHMPFLFSLRDQLLAAFCSSTPTFRLRRGKWIPGQPGPWKLKWVLPFVPATVPVDTGLAAHDIECSPCVSLDDGKMQLSFIGTIVADSPARGTTVDGMPHRLFSMTGNSFDALGKATPVSDEECYAGFARSDLTATASGMDGIVTLRGRYEGKLETSFERIERISFCFDWPERLLITGRCLGCGPQTVMYDLANDELVGELRVQGEPVHKGSLCNGLLTLPKPPVCKRNWTLWYTKEFEFCRLDERGFRARRA